jgi:hypothetical protein
MTGWAKVNTSGSGTYTMTGFNVTIGGYNATFGPSGSVIITNVTSGQDRFLLQAQSPVGASISVPGGSVSPLLFNIDLKGPATLFSSNALPSSLPSISSFSNLNSWRLVFGTGQGRIVSGTLTALTAVPLPAAVVLFGAGLVALAGLGAGSWRQRKNHITA